MLSFNPVDEARKQLMSIFGEAAVKAGSVMTSVRKPDELIEDMQPVYFNEKFKEECNIPTLYRYNQSGSRFYFSVEEPKPEPEVIEEGPVYAPQLLITPLDSPIEGVDNTTAYMAEPVAAPEPEPVKDPEPLVKFYPSVTTILRKTMPTPDTFLKMRGEKGNDGFYKWLKEKSDYGTLLHKCFADYLRESAFDFDSVPGRIAVYCQENYISYSTYEWDQKLRKDMASLIQFVYDKEVEPIAIEVVGRYEHGNHKFAGAIDILCKLNFNKKRITAIVDLKSGKSGFFEEHQIQLGMYKLMAEQSFGVKIDKIFNLAPNDFNEKPTYTLTNQTDSAALEKIPHVLNLFMLDYKEPRDIQIISGQCNGKGDLTENCKKVPVAEYVVNKINFKKQFSRN